MQDNTQSLQGQVLSAPDSPPASGCLNVDDIEFKPKAPDKTKDKITLMEDAFCRSYVKVGFNATKAYQQLRPKMTDKIAKERGYKYLLKQRVKDRIVQIINQSELKEMEIINRALETETPKQISWKEIHSFTRTALELKGKLNKDQKGPNINIGLVIER